MVRTKKQVIDSLATKSKQSEYNLESATLPDTQNISVTTEFYASNVPRSPLPSSILHQEKIKVPPPQQYHPMMIPAMPIMTRNPFFEPPQYVENNFRFPPPLQSSIQNVLTAGVSGKRLESTFSNLSQQEIRELMADCKGNEDEAILRLITQTGYLEYIRHRILINSKKIADMQNVASVPIHQQILPQQRTIKPSHPTYSSSSALSQPVPLHQQFRENTTFRETTTLSPSTTALRNKRVGETVVVSSAPPSSDLIAEPSTQYKTYKKHQRSCKSSNSSNSSSCNSSGSGGRLTLDDALQQIQDSKINGESDGYAGWSAARLRAFKMIDKNPNSYYYRFNAPGEQQKKGKWTDEENALFLKRLKEVGANSQWGIFSIAIPGRVGYQCSNYYRFMIEMGQLHDPNYVLDEKGKARYLFDKKTEDGAVEKIFRKHSKHGSAPAKDLSYQRPVSKKRKQNRPEEDSDDDDDPTFSIKRSSAKKKTSSSTKITKSTPRVSNNKRVTRQNIHYQETEEDNYNNDSDFKEQQADHVVQLEKSTRSHNVITGS